MHEHGPIHSMLIMAGCMVVVICMLVGLMTVIVEVLR